MNHRRAVYKTVSTRRAAKFQKVKSFFTVRRGMRREAARTGTARALVGGAPAWSRAALLCRKVARAVVLAVVIELCCVCWVTVVCYPRVAVKVACAAHICCLPFTLLHRLRRRTGARITRSEVTKTVWLAVLFGDDA